MGYRTWDIHKLNRLPSEYPKEDLETGSTTKRAWSRPPSGRRS